MQPETRNKSLDIHPLIQFSKYPSVFSIVTVISQSRSACKSKRGRCLKNLKPVKSTSKEPLPSSFIKFTYINIGSLKNKTASLYDYICENRVDVVVLTETWLFAVEEENTVYINSLLPAGFLFKHCPRPDGHRGGGVGLVYCDYIMI